MTNPRSTNHRALIAELQDKFHAAIGDLLSGSEVSLLDFPLHPNVGDAAIWVGEAAYLARARKQVRYCSSFANLDAARLGSAAAEGPLLLHGGGNFGDIWLHHQEFREHVLERFREARVIQLPQSIHFRSEERAERTARIIERHRDFVLLVRDEPSLEFARRKFQCETRLCPDAAFNIGAQGASRPTLEVLALMRTDQERSPLRVGSIPEPIPTEDWLQESRVRNRAVAMLGLVSGSVRGPDRARLSRFNAVARARVRRGFDQLSRGKAIVTDRLHGHILSTLLGRPQALLDNDYGKIGRFLDAFTGPTTFIHRAHSLRDAVDWARERARKDIGTEPVAA